MKTILPTVFARAAIVTLFTLWKKKKKKKKKNPQKKFKKKKKKKKEKHEKRFSEMRKNDQGFSMRVGHVESKEGNAHLRLH